MTQEVGRAISRQGGGHMLQHRPQVSPGLVTTAVDGMFVPQIFMLCSFCMTLATTWVQRLAASDHRPGGVAAAALWVCGEAASTLVAWWSVDRGLCLAVVLARTGRVLWPMGGLRSLVATPAGTGAHTALCQKCFGCCAQEGIGPA